MQVTINQAKKLVETYIRAKLVPMLKGSPGIGKSAIVHAIADAYNLKLIDLRLSQCDPNDINGFPKLTGDRACYAPMNTFPIEGDAIPEGYSGWLLFLDEFNSAPIAVQSAAYKLVLDRMVGLHKLHKNVAIVCAGNKETDNAIVQPMSTAMQSRLAHIDLMLDPKEWVEFAQKQNFNHYITDYIQAFPDKLFTFNPDHSDETYGCPRTWQFADSVLKVTEAKDPNRIPLLAGVLSEGLAREFIHYTEIYESLPKWEKMVSEPELIPIPKEPSILYGFTGVISYNTNEETLAQVMKLVARMPKEWQVVCMRQLMRRKPQLKKLSPVVKWVADSANELFADAH